MYILGLETSCDDTAVALYHTDYGLLDHRVRSQMDLLETYKGVVPELASREHIQHLLPLVDEVIKPHCRIDQLDAIAYTRGPGLVGALLCGYSIAQGLALACNIPCIGIHHLEAHIQAIFLQEQTPSYPFVTLLASGGHTMIIHAASFGQYSILGASIDDAAGEAFDKIAKLIGLGFPGGAKLAELAKKGDACHWDLPRPMLAKKYGYDMSFSGLKTAAKMIWDKIEQPSDLTKAHLAASYQAAIVDVLVKKTKSVLVDTELKQLVLAGGVAANDMLRNSMSLMTTSLGVKLYLPEKYLCTDNAAMVARTGAIRFQQSVCGPDDLGPTPRWSIESLSGKL